MRSIEGVMAFLQGRYKEVEQDLEQRMREAAAVHEFEQAAVERNRLQAVRPCSSASAWRTRRWARSTRSASRCRGTDANAQVFQVRDGVL